MKTLLLTLMLLLTISCKENDDGTLAASPSINENTPDEKIEKILKHLAFSLNATDETISVFLVNNKQFYYIGTVDAGSGTRTMSVHPTGKWLYSTSGNTDSVTVWEVDVVNRALNVVAEVNTGGTFPNGLEVSLDGTMLFTTNANSDDVSSLTINTDTGIPTPVGNYAVGTSPQDIKQINSFLYIANYHSNNITVFHIEDDASLTLVETKSTGTNPFRMSVDRINDRLFVPSKADNTVEAFITAADGTLTSTDVESVGTNPSAVFYYNDHLYVSNRDDDDLDVFTVNADGSLFKIQNITSVCTSPFAMNQIDGMLMLACEGDATVQYFTIGSDGILGLQDSLGVDASPYDVEAVGFLEE